MTKELSPPAQAFQRFVESNPECLDRSSFRLLDEPHDLIKYSLASWPTFIDSAEAAEVERIGVGFSQLIKSIPQRFFACDPARLQEFYGLEPRAGSLIARLLQRPGCLEVAVGRGDFMETSRGLQCMEFNITGNLGGWESKVMAGLYRQVPVLQRFFAGSGFEFGYVEPVHQLFTHILTSWETYYGPFEDELNILFLVQMEGPTPDKRQPGDPGEVHLQQTYRETLEAVGLDIGGTVILAPLAEVQGRGDRLFVGDTRIHVVVEFMDYQEPEPAIIRSLLTRTSLVLDGPVSFVLGDKKNLALLSEQADSPMFDDAERELIRNHLPWTRTVAPGHTTFAGRRVYLPDLLVAERERLVLKTRRGSRGRGVLIGRHTEPEYWAETVRKALEDGLSIVQELAEPSPRPHQTGASGVVPCDIVWGLFVFGKTFAGSFLRLAPSGSQGAINCAQGAEEGMVFVAAP